MKQDYIIVCYNITPEVPSFRSFIPIKPSICIISIDTDYKWYRGVTYRVFYQCILYTTMETEKLWKCIKHIVSITWFCRTACIINYLIYFIFIGYGIV